MKSFHFIEPVKVQAFKDLRGNLGVSDFGGEPKFVVQRIYYIYGVPEGASRGAHGHKKPEQVFYALKGNFQLSVTDGAMVDKVELRESGDGYYVPEGLWRDIASFSSDCVCLVLASLPYDETDYIFEYEAFKAWREKK